MKRCFFTLLSLNRFSLILFSLTLMLSCQQSPKEKLIQNDADSVWDEFPCWPFLQCNEPNPSIHYVLPISNSLPGTKEWDSIWVTIHCNSYWRMQKNKICVDSIDTSSVSVYMHAEKKNNYKNFFYSVGENRDDICQEAIAKIFNDAYPSMVKAQYSLTDECDNVDSVALKNVVFENGLAKTYLKYNFLLYPSQDNTTQDKTSASPN